MTVLTSDSERPQNQLVYIATHGTQAKVSTTTWIVRTDLASIDTSAQANDANPGVFDKLL